jgi:hypothetical protein
MNLVEFSQKVATELVDTEKQLNENNLILSAHLVRRGKYSFFIHFRVSTLKGHADHKMHGRTLLDAQVPADFFSREQLRILSMIRTEFINK